MRRLPNTSAWPSADLQPPLGNRAKRLNVLGTWPGRPNLTSEFFSRRDAVTTDEFKANGAIHINVSTKTKDQAFLNAYQYAFYDFREGVRNAKLVGLAQMNKFLAERQAAELAASNASDRQNAAPGQGVQGVGDDDDSEVMSVDAMAMTYDQTGATGGATFGDTVGTADGEENRNEKTSLSYILNTFRPFGVIATTDRDLLNNSGHSTGRHMVAAIKGGTRIYDYWSYSGNLLQPLDTCFFLVKKIKVPANHKYQIEINTPFNNMGQTIPGLEGKYIWQVVPYHTQDNHIPHSAYTTVNKETGVRYLGHYWKVGTIHEYLTMTDADKYMMRDELSVSRDVTYLIGDSNTIPHQVYLTYDHGVL